MTNTWIYYAICVFDAQVYVTERAAPVHGAGKLSEGAMEAVQNGVARALANLRGAALLEYLTD